MVAQKTIKLNEHYVKKKYNTPNKNVVTNSDGVIDFEDKIDIDAINNAKEDKSNKIKHYNEGSLINGQGTDDQYVSAKALYELLISPQSAVTNGHSHGTIYIDNIPLSNGPRPFTMIDEQKIKLFEHLMFDYENDLSLYYLQGDEEINFNDFALKSEIPSATVATTGSYNDLIDKPTIPSVTGKVNVSDIKDNLISTDSDKPLSANQGKVLKGLIDGKSDSGHSHSQYLTSDSLTNYVTTDDSRLSDSRTPVAHEHNTGEVKDTSAYSNIGSSENSTQKTINDKINIKLGLKADTNNVYDKSETDTLLNGKVDTNDSRLSDERIPKAHTSSDASTYGEATTGMYGHVKLSTSTSSSEKTGVAATPSAVRAAYELAQTAQETADDALAIADSKPSTVRYKDGVLTIK